MRIMNVSVSAFGSYQGTEEFPLEELGAEGLYLIYGNTGSGKTTLFDAICFALFGEASGGYRQPKELRCEYANPKVDTKVILTFEVYGKRYELTRWYAMNRERDKITGMKQKLVLLNPDPDEPLITLEKSDPVNDYVENLLKVNRKQFKKIAMIAQGEFQDVLLASTGERSAIFSSMFGTERYKKIQEQIKLDFDQVKDKKEENERDIKGALGRVSFFGEESEQLQTLGEELKTGQVNLMDSGVELEELVESQKISLVEAEQEKAKAEEGLKETEAYFLKLNKAQEVLKQKNEALKKLQQQQEVLKQANLDLKATDSYPEKVEEIKEALAQVKHQMERCLEVEEAEKEVKKLSLEVEELVSKEKNCLAQKESKEKTEIELKKWLKENEKLGETVIYLEQKVTALQEEEHALQQLETQLNQVESKEKEKKTAQVKYETSKKQWDAQRESWVQQTRTYLDEQAGILAENLKEGEPCTVCGSLSHPNPAKTSDKTCTSEELEKLRLLSEEKEKETQKLSETLGEINKELSGLLGALISHSLKLLNTDDLELIPDVLSGKRKDSTLKDHEKELKELKGLLQEKEKKEEEIEGIEREKEEKEREIQAISADKDKKIGILGEKGSNLEKEIEKLEGQTVAKLELEKIALETEKKQKETKRARATSNLSQAEVDLATCEGVVNGLENADDSTELLETKEEFEEKQRACQALKEQWEKIEKKLVVVLSNNQNIHREILALLVERKGILDKQKWIDPLHLAANGSMRLETFVQVYYFDLVLEEANAVYTRMNNNRYMMLRDEEKDGKAGFGLGVKIYELETGKIRRARTLSGGESFQASLALALGFSQAVAQEAQSAPIQSLFLDEGFGSLDGDTLQEAIGTLLELAQEGRMVGIISHVEELKDAIPKRILVEKTPRGSKVTFQGIGKKTEEGSF